MNKFLRTAYPTPSNKTTGTPTAASGGRLRGAGGAGEGPSLADRAGGPSGPSRAGLDLERRPPRSRTKGGGTRAPSRHGHRLRKANPFYNLNSTEEPRPDSPRCSDGRQPHPRAPSFGPR